MVLVVKGTIHGLGKRYTDNSEPMEIWVPSGSANGLPYSYDVRVPIDLHINGEYYLAGLRATLKNSYVWISPNVKTKDGVAEKLAHVLTVAGFKKNDKVFLHVDGTKIVLKAAEALSQELMKFEVAEFLEFAKSVESREWFTLHQKKAFRFSVESRGILVIPSTGDERLISNKEIARFCEMYSQSNSHQPKDYKELFNKSYLLSLATSYEPSRIEFALAEEVIDTANLREGAVRLVAVNAYERNSEARRICIEVHGTNCTICGFNFGELYGDIAVGFIHVHHLSPIALRGEEHAIDPVTDLRPVCPNCHAVIHIRGGCMSIEEVKDLLRKRA
jgi:5-methylcytosine-specific restriction protein A